MSDTIKTKIGPKSNFLREHGIYMGQNAISRMVAGSTPDKVNDFYQST
jgi:hypothetical protein